MDDEDETNEIKAEKSFETIISWTDFLVKTKHVCDDNDQIKSNVKKDDFKFLRLIAVGTFCEVYKVKLIKDQKVYAVKKYPPEHNSKGDREKFLLNCINFHFIIFMEDFFQDDQYLYIVLPFIEAGDLFTLLKQLKKFNENLSQFYAAQVLLAVEYLHNLNIIYRDMKPENIVLDRSGYIKLVDFGLSKLTDSRTYTLCGTPEYLAPEMLTSKGYGKAVDFWAFGVLIYEFNAGVSPFSAPKEATVMENIINGIYEDKPHFSDELKDLIKKLLNTDSSKRFGNMVDGADDIRDHNWFINLSWFHILNKVVEPPYVPIIAL